MKLLVVASDKGGHFVPFIEEQITALEALGVQIIRYGITGKGIMGYLRCLPALRRLIRAERPDIVHAHYGLSGLLANLQRMVPVITTYHGSDINKPSIRRFSKIAMRLSAHNIFVSARSASLAMGNGLWAIDEETNRQSPIANHPNKATGLLFESDNADELAEKMLWALAHPAEVQTIITNAQAEVQKYSWANIRQQLMKLYE